MAKRDACFENQGTDKERQECQIDLDGNILKCGILAFEARFFKEAMADTVSMVPPMFLREVSKDGSCDLAGGEIAEEECLSARGFAVGRTGGGTGGRTHVSSGVPLAPTLTPCCNHLF